MTYLRIHGPKERVKRRKPIQVADLLGKVETQNGLTPEMVAAALEVSPQRYAEWVKGSGAPNDYGITLLNLLANLRYTVRPSRSAESSDLQRKLSQCFACWHEQALARARAGGSIKDLLPLRPIACDQTGFRWGGAALRFRKHCSNLSQYRFAKRLNKYQPDLSVPIQQSMVSDWENGLPMPLEFLLAITSLAHAAGKKFPLE